LSLFGSDPRFQILGIQLEGTNTSHLKCRPLGGSPLEEDETETFKLLPHSLGRTLIGLNKAQVVLPNIDVILKPDERDMLQARFGAAASLQKVDGLIMEATRNSDRPGLDVTTVLNNLHAVESTPHRRLYTGLLD
jgi:hypothetical protein